MGEPAALPRGLTMSGSGVSPGIVAIADVHVGNHGRFGGELTDGLNRRCWLVVEALRQATKVAREEGACLVIAGDLFDRHDPPARMVEAVMEVLSQAGEVIVVCGNHDRADAGHHALGPLTYLRNVEVAVRPRTYLVNGWEVLCVPFQRGQGREWLERDLLALADGPPAGRRALVTHLGLRTPETPWYLRESSDAIDATALVDLCLEAGVSSAFLGNWHTPVDVDDRGVEVRQVGALVPTGWDDPGPGYGRLVGPSWIGPRVPGPRFLDWGRHAVDPRPHTGQYVRARVTPDQEPEVRAALEALRATGAVAACEILVVQEAAPVVPRARSSRAEALRARVDATTVDAPGSREAVYDWCARELAIGKHT